MVGATLVDALNEGLDKLEIKFLTPYLGNEQLVDFLDPRQFYYLPPQQPYPEP